MPEDFYKKARSIESPCIISFMQGVQTTIGRDYINVFSMAGGELIDGAPFFIEKGRDGKNYYHYESCSEITDNKDKWSSMDECARKGAYPCPVCVLK